MRQTLPAAPEWSQPRVKESWSIKIRVITPMFGGGYEAREIDEVNIIRPAAIRGHLRFWWRATAGAQYRTAKESYKAECALWGGAAENTEKEKDKAEQSQSAGKVAVRVAITNSGTPKKHSEIAPQSTPQQGPREGYFLFPFQQQTGENPAPEASARVGVEFSLTLVLDQGLSEEQKRQVKNSVRAWLAFGGVGARTRRGCGALQVIGNNAGDWMPPADRNKRQGWFKSLVQSGNPHAQWTVLFNATIILGQSQQNPMQVWGELGKFWARFRKGHVGNTQYSPMSGSKWQDYRKVLVGFSSHSELRLAKPFLGLPIIYQSFRNAPFSGTIEAESSGRMSSPVILKPLALENGQVVPMVAVLSAPRPQKIKINGRVVQLLPPDPQDDPVMQELKDDPVMQELKDDPVMQELRAKSTLVAVIAAARKYVGKAEEIEVITLRGGS